MIRRCMAVSSGSRRDGRKGSTRLPWHAACVAMAMLLLPGVLDAQLHRPDRPVDSPLWWTLTDEVTPAELKRLFSDRSLSLERYDAAVAAGLADPLPERGAGGRECLDFYLNRDLTPELEPMWLAFDTFFRVYAPDEQVDEERAHAAPLDLRRFGVSPSGVETILRAAAATEAEFDSLMDDLGPKMREMTVLLGEVYYEDPQRAALAPPHRQVLDAVELRDYQTVASAVGRSVSEIRDLVDSHADWDAPYALVAEALPRLKEELTDEDWQGLRRYLLETVVARKGNSRHFAEACGDSER